MGKMPSLVDEAEIVLGQRKLKQVQGDKIKTDRQTIEIFRRRFKTYILQAPIALEILMQWYHINEELSLYDIAETILNQNNRIGFFNLDIGLFSLNLIQTEVPSTKPVKLPPTEFHGWAIKFSGVYDLDLYFVPFVDTNKGFACTVIKSTTALLNSKTVFSHDIARENAVNWIADYKGSQGE